jgi:N-acetylmuramoyl-L-alanine amidase
MSKKIYISPSDQIRNEYAVGGTNEKEQCHLIAAALVTALERCGLQAKTNYTASMAERVRESNEWKADLHLPIHTNAHNGKVQGTRLFSFDDGGAGNRACEAIMDTLAPITPGESDAITTANFYEIKYAVAPTAYIEVGFHDNAEEARWIIENTEKIAEAICQGICAFFDLSYQAPKVEQPEEKPLEENTFYRVQVGAFKNRGFAEVLVDKLKAAGFHDAYIKTN